MSKVKTIIESANSKGKSKYNILTFPTHERYETQLCKTGHDFYSFRYDNCKEWDDNYAKRPDNYYILPKNSVLSGLDFDLILNKWKNKIIFRKWYKYILENKITSIISLLNL